MNLLLKPAKLSGTVHIPASKSAAHRMLICAALAEGDSVITNLDFSKDIYATLDVLRSFGAAFELRSRSVTVHGIGSARPAQAQCRCGESGSTLRFLIPVAAALGIQAEFHGEGRLPERPITAYLRELPLHGVQFSYAQTMPFTLSGQLKPGVFSLEGNVSSQYITGLLLALPLLHGDSEIHLTSPLESRPYANMTIAVLRQYGVLVHETKNGYMIPGGQTYTPCSGDVEGDYSQAAFFYAANALGSSVEISGLDPESVQGDKVIEPLCRQIMGNPAGAMLTIHAEDIPDIVPILAVVSCFGRGRVHITGAHRLAIKESDRLATTAGLLNALGGRVRADADGLWIEPVGVLHGGAVDSCGDHRIAMCAAIAATGADGEIELKGAQCVEKSYPQFFEDYQSLGGVSHVISVES